MAPASNPKLEAEAHLRVAYPSIAWDEPIKIVVGSAERLGCRYCIALVGLKGSDAHLLPESYRAFNEHLQEAHSRSSEICSHGNSIPDPDCGCGV